MESLLKPLPCTLILSTLILSGCLSSSSSDSSATQQSSTIQTNTENSTTLDVAHSVTAHPRNTLMAVLNASTESAPFQLQARYYSDDSYSATRSIATFATQQEMTIIGLRAETTYNIDLTYTFADGSTRQETVNYTSGSLPDSAPSINLITAATTEATSGITFFGAGVGQRENPSAPLYYGVDNDGYIVWYLHDTNITATNAVLRHVEGNQFYIFSDEGIVKINSDGEQLETYNMGSINRWHHDAILLPNGNRVALVQETQTINGERMTGDQLIEVDSDGNEIWSWSSFDHLDTTRFPGNLSSTTTRQGALDWTHANSVFYDESDDSFIMSLRSQSWVIKVDHQSGELKWIMGGSNDIADDYDAPFISLLSGDWMANQHAATITSDGKILIYDNANESDGPINNSRGVIYELDENELTANQIWSHRSSKYTSSLGDADELENGNILLNSGGPGSHNNARIIEATRPVDDRLDAETVSEIEVENTSVYRAEKVSWDDFLKI